MLIGIDGNEANIAKRVGVNVYAYELLKNLYNVQTTWENKHEFIIYLRADPQSDMPKERVGWKYEVLPSRALWILTRLTPHLFTTNNKPQVLFTPSHYVPLVAPIPRVCAIMDLGYLNNSEQFGKLTFWQLKYWTAKSISVSKRIIAISKATKKDIVRHYPSASTKIVITHLGYNKSLFNINISSVDVRRVKEKYKLSDNYVLFVSTLKPSKNLDGLLQAFSLLDVKMSQTQLVIAGKKGWMYESIFALVEKLDLKDRVVFTGFIDEEDKPALIAGAKVFVAPSHWEGFGLHVLEAMACGTPVVVSDRGSLPEVVGGAGIVVDPDDPEDISNGLSAVLGLNNVEYNRLVAKGIKQAKKFDWEKTTTETLKIIEDTVK